MFLSVLINAISLLTEIGFMEKATFVHLRDSVNSFQDFKLFKLLRPTPDSTLIQLNS